MLNCILFILILYVTILIVVYFGDYILIKTVLKTYKPIPTRIIDIDRVQPFAGNGGYDVTIVTYYENGKEKDAVISHQKSDKIGDCLDIVTDGCLAVRCKVGFDSINTMLICLGVGIALIYYAIYSYSIGVVVPIWMIFVELLFCIAVLVLHPLLAKSRDKSTKAYLGWHKYKKYVSVEQEKDDAILIGVCIGAVLIFTVVMFVLGYW